MDFETISVTSPTGLKADLTYEEYVRRALDATYLGVDTEGTGFLVRDGRDYSYGVGTSFITPGYGQIEAYFPYRHPYGTNLSKQHLAVLKDMLVGRARSGKTLPLVFQNFKYDNPALQTLGIDLTSIPEYFFYDILLMAALINENWPKNKNLENLAQYYCKEGKRDQPPKSLFPVMPSEVIASYGAWDPNITLKTFLAILPKFLEEDLEEVWLQKMNTMKHLAKMEKRGVYVNKEICEKQYYLGTEVMADIANHLGLNPGSPKDLGILLLDKLGLPVVKVTDKGNPSFDKDAMEIYDEILERVDNSTARLVNEYRGWQKATSACYGSYLKRVSPDGRVRTSYHMHRTLTGRLSSSDPNLQQIPRASKKEWHGKVKQAFTGQRRNGHNYVLLEGDYSQLEFRLGALYAQEQSLISTFNDPSQDIFTMMASQLDMPRQDTKTQTYTTMYGGGVKRLSQVFGISYEEAAKRRQNFYTVYPNLKAISDYAALKCKQQGYLKLWNGRRRHFSRPKDEAHKAFNSVMQGGAADIVECALDRIMREVDHEEECRTLMQVHDSLVFEVREDLVSTYIPRIKEAMERVNDNPFGQEFPLNFKVDVHYWGE